MMNDRIFVKFKISNHKLMIEQGRYQIDHLPRENRLCPLCNSNQVEEWIHLFFQSSKCSVQRQAFINEINRIIPDFDKKSSPESIVCYTAVFSVVTQRSSPQTAAENRTTFLSLCVCGLTNKPIMYRRFDNA